MLPLLRKLMISLFLLSFFIPSLALGASLSPEQFRRGVQELHSLYSSKQFKQALKKARQLTVSVVHNVSPRQRAKLYLYLGMTLCAQKQKVLAWAAFQRALTLYPSLSFPTTAPHSMKELFDKVRSHQLKKLHYSDPFLPTASGSSSKSSPLFLVAGISLVVGMVGLAAGVAAGLSAKDNANQAADLYYDALEKKLSEPLITPTIFSLRDQAIQQSTIANISYIIGGVGIVGAATLFFLASLKPSSSKKVALLPTSFRQNEFALVRSSSLPTFKETKRINLFKKKHILSIPKYFSRIH